MSLRDWVASIKVRPLATPATIATPDPKKGELSQLSQLSQPVGVELPQGEADREAFEERAAIMEFDGGLSRDAAERAASISKVLPSSEPKVAPDRFTAPRWPFEEWGDLRPCTLCRNLLRSGRCRAAWVGLLRAARDYEPSHPAQPRRCIGYDPKADDPDQSAGMERWPELAQWQKRIAVNNA